MWWPAAVCGRLSPTAPHRDFPGGGETQHKTHDLTSACQAPAHAGSGAPRYAAHTLCCTPLRTGPGGRHGPFCSGERWSLVRAEKGMSLEGGWVQL